MRNRLGILLSVVLLIFVLIGLNAATYVQREKTPDAEIRPNRSTFNPGATGTQAFYSLLAETGRKVTRWQQPIEALKTERRGRPSTFVVIGSVRKPFDEIEAKALLDWVKAGGRLVLIDRTPPDAILDAMGEWRMTAKTHDLELMFGIDPTDQKQMTTEMPASRPVQPSLLTLGVNAVQTSRFASHIEFSRVGGKDTIGTNGYGGDSANEDKPVKGDPHIPAEQRAGPTVDEDTSNAPVVHLAGHERNILVEAGYGHGKIAILTDPYVVSNPGISLADNAQLAINLVAAENGLVAFDEYHQGFGSDQNRFFQYFAGTPVIAIFTQIALVAAFVFYSQSRRFARPVPEPEPDRRSKLEYVSAMAELQQRTQAYDLAIENIYSDFRRNVSRLFGVDNTMTGRKQLAALIAERIKADSREIEELMFTCEDIIHGEPTNKKKTVEAAGRLRELASQLGLGRSARARVIK